MTPEELQRNQWAKAPTLRTSLAGQCLAGMLANPNYSPVRQGGESHSQACARRAFDYADDLLAEAARLEAVEGRKA